ncbi:sensor histidine kinase [Pedococcus soli]
MLPHDGGAAAALRADDDGARDRQENVRLRRRLERERAARLEAEDIGERVTAELYGSLQELRELHDQQDEAIRRLRDLDHAKDAFLSTVSHELRTPLTSMIAYLEMIEDGDVPSGPAMSNAVDVMSRNAHRLRHLVEELLTFSELEQHQEAMALQQVDLVEIVQEARRSLLPVATRRRLAITVAADESVPSVEGDRTLLERVVLNLLNNAVKFTPEDGRVCARVARDDAHVVVHVADTGIGIPADEQDRVFTRFFRSSRSVAEEIQGTGLGLALVEAAVQRHHGTVSLASVEGEGTTVTVRLPIESVERVGHDEDRGRPPRA